MITNILHRVMETTTIKPRARMVESYFLEGVEKGRNWELVIFVTCFLQCLTSRWSQLNPS
jgi:hypothetical protein